MTIEPGDILEVTKIIGVCYSSLSGLFTLDIGDHIVILRKRVYDTPNSIYIDFVVSHWGKTGCINYRDLNEHCRKI